MNFVLLIFAFIFYPWKNMFILRDHEQLKQSGKVTHALLSLKLFWNMKTQWKTS